MSHVASKMLSCYMSNVVSLIFLLMSLSSMSHVDCKKKPCRRIEFKGQGPLSYCNTEKMSPVYICQNDKPMTSLALSTAHQVKTNLCQPHSLKGCHIFVINLPKTCHPQFLFHAVDGSRVPI